MDLKIPIDTLNTNLLWTNSMEKNFTTKHVLKSDERRTTDKYWIGFFGIIFISWIVAWQNAIIRHGTNYKHLPDIRTLANHSIHLADNDTSYSIISGRTVVEEIISKFVQQEIADIDANTCTCEADRKNEIIRKERLFMFVDVLIFEEDHFHKAFVNWPNPIERISTSNWVILSILLLICSFSIIFKLNVYHKQTAIICAVFIYIALIEHLSIAYDSCICLSSPFLPHKVNLVGWIIPELLFLILVLLYKMCSRVSRDKSKDFYMELLQNSVDLDSKHKKADNTFDIDIVKSRTDDSVDNDFEAYSDDGTVPFHNFIYAIIFGFSFVALLRPLHMSTTSILHRTGWSCPYSYIIAVGSCYIGLTIYYFGLMLTACATNILIDSKTFAWRDLLRALFIVVRYHFGTACYHATLIFPRLHATVASSAINQSEFKINEEYRSVLCRFFITHCEIYSFSPILTAAHGYSHSYSIKKLLNLFNQITLKKKFFYNYFELCILLLIFLLTTNGLSILTLKCLNAYNFAFTIASGTMYFRIVLMFSVTMIFFKTVTDIFGLRACAKDDRRRKNIQKSHVVEIFHY